MDIGHFQFFDSAEAVDLRQLQLLFQLSAFWAANRQVEDLEIAIAHSNPVITVWEGERQIGFARATSDGIYRAVIWDVVIHPEYQGVGLGRRLVETIVSHPHVRQTEKIYLMTTQQEGFYAHIGFTPSPASTMQIDNRTLVSSVLTSRPPSCSKLEASQVA